MESKGLLPGWEFANDWWPGGCQSCVSTTFSKRLASSFTTGTTSSPFCTASLPPGQKSFCTSTTMSASAAPGLSFSAMSRRALDLDQAVVEGRAAADVGDRLRRDFVRVAAVRSELLPPYGERDHHALARLVPHARPCDERA